MLCWSHHTYNAMFIALPTVKFNVNDSGNFGKQLWKIRTTRRSYKKQFSNLDYFSSLLLTLAVAFSFIPVDQTRCFLPRSYAALTPHAYERMRCTSSLPVRPPSIRWTSATESSAALPTRDFTGFLPPRPHSRPIIQPIIKPLFAPRASEQYDWESASTPKPSIQCSYQWVSTEEDIERDPTASLRWRWQFMDFAMKFQWIPWTLRKFNERMPPVRRRTQR